MNVCERSARRRPEGARHARGDLATAAGLARLDGRRQAWSDLEQVTDDDEVGELADRRVGVPVDGDDRARRLDADLVLDRAADAARDVERRLDDLARLADLLAIGDPPASTAARVAPTAPPIASARSSIMRKPSGRRRRARHRR